MTPTWTFPCAADKSPISQHGFKDAFQGMEWRNAPLVGAPTGERNGFDCLDIDPDGMGWYATKFGAIPATRRHETPRGVHLLFRSAPGLRCSTSRIVPGVHIRAEGGYVVWWPRQGYAVDDVAVADWPDWLLEAARGHKRKDEGKVAGGPNVYPRTSFIGLREDGSHLVDALRQIDPRDFGKDPDKDHYEEWFALAGACKAVGIAREVFVEWSVSDPDYANDGPKIERIWESAIGAHGGAFHKALSDRGIKLVPNKKCPGVHIWTAATVPASPPRNLQSRSNGLMVWLARNATGDGLYSAACLLAEIGVTQETTTKLVVGNLPSLRRAIGDAEFTRQIARAYARIEGKQNAGENQC